MIHVSAPSNIALIKYMGKTDAQSNIPTNASLSYTVDYLITHVELTPASQDSWRLLEGYYPMVLSQKGVDKFLRFFAFLKERLQITGSFQISSANTFPSDAGLASSASSFAALTRAAYQLSCEQHGEKAKEILLQTLDISETEALARISRKGSGSSCRSFFSGFCEWREEQVHPIELPYNDLDHMVLLLEESKKSVSSSEAHVRVTTSQNFQGRPERAERRLRHLVTSLTNKDWTAAQKVVWDEFIDMHNLFETAEPPFSLMTKESHMALAKIMNLLESDGDGPLVTMDAGPNIHLFFNKQQEELFKKYKSEFSSLKWMSNR